MTPDGTPADVVTLVNVFEVQPDKLEWFLEGWRERARLMSEQPGFRSLRLLRALSAGARFQFVNVAEWDSADALEAATAHGEFQESAQRAVEDLGVIAHPGIYRVAIEVTTR